MAARPVDAGRVYTGAVLGRGEGRRFPGHLPRLGMLVLVTAGAGQRRCCRIAVRRGRALREGQ
eukprot:200073-Pyramimonas_sp.AAC.2